MHLEQETVWCKAILKRSTHLFLPQMFAGWSQCELLKADFFSGRALATIRVADLSCPVVIVIVIVVVVAAPDPLPTQHNC